MRERAREDVPEGGYPEIGGAVGGEAVDIRALELLAELAEDALGREGGREGWDGGDNDAKNLVGSLLASPSPFLPPSLPPFLQLMTSS